MTGINGVPYGVRIDYTHEGGTWWAYASLQFSSADESLAELKHRVHKALEEILGKDVQYVEVVMQPKTPSMEIIHPWNSPDLGL